MVAAFLIIAFLMSLAIEYITKDETNNNEFLSKHINIEDDKSSE
jgi:hypothetical protein